MSQIEQNGSNTKFDRRTIEYVEKVGQLLVYKDHLINIKNLDWNKLQKTYEDITKEAYDGTANYFGVTYIEPHYELIIEKVSFNNYVDEKFC